MDNSQYITNLCYTKYTSFSEIYKTPSLTPYTIETHGVTPIPMISLHIPKVKAKK